MDTYKSALPSSPAIMTQLAQASHVSHEASGRGDGLPAFLEYVSELNHFAAEQLRLTSQRQRMSAPGMVEGPDEREITLGHFAQEATSLLREARGRLLSRPRPNGITSHVTEPEGTEEGPREHTPEPALTEESSTYITKNPAVNAGVSSLSPTDGLTRSSPEPSLARSRIDSDAPSIREEPDTPKDNGKGKGKAVREPSQATSIGAGHKANLRRIVSGGRATSSRAVCDATPRKTDVCPSPMLLQKETWDVPFDRSPPCSTLGKSLLRPGPPVSFLTSDSLVGPTKMAPKVVVQAVPRETRTTLVSPTSRASLPSVRGTISEPSSPASEDQLTQLRVGKVAELDTAPPLPAVRCRVASQILPISCRVAASPAVSTAQHEVQYRDVAPNAKEKVLLYLQSLPDSEHYLLEGSGQVVARECEEIGRSGSSCEATASVRADFDSNPPTPDGSVNGGEYESLGVRSVRTEGLTRASLSDGPVSPREKLHVAVTLPQCERGGLFLEGE
ncbi:hypothetical protein ONZ51_g11454 [Trametes cubensis]|uniref:Uncharacterized protein n=1 Tax=Trametes cubensis TaxID=1111947 RepID=A0AAD7TK47_9APHY|nr:hypothetical protein ONZ51_g11454 [Trametes cubensis]